MIELIVNPNQESQIQEENTHANERFKKSGKQANCNVSRVGLEFGISKLYEYLSWPKSK